MEKNAVLGASRSINEKIAARGCPACGAALDNTGSLPRCPVHGTAPFEVGYGMQKSASLGPQWTTSRSRRP